MWYDISLFLKLIYPPLPSPPSLLLFEMEQFAVSDRLEKLLKSSSSYDYDYYGDEPYVSNAFSPEWINQMESKCDIPSEVNHLFIVYDPIAGKDGLERVLTSMIFIGDTCVVSYFI